MGVKGLHLSRQRLAH